MALCIPRVAASCFKFISLSRDDGRGCFDLHMYVSIIALYAPVKFMFLLLPYPTTVYN